METISIKRKIQNGNIYYYLDDQEIARSFLVPLNERINPARMPEYNVRFLPESKTIYGNFPGRGPKDAVQPYLDHKMYQYFIKLGIQGEIIDIY